MLWTLLFLCMISRRRYDSNEVGRRIPFYRAYRQRFASLSSFDSRCCQFSLHSALGNLIAVTQAFTAYQPSPYPSYQLGIFTTPRCTRPYLSHALHLLWHFLSLSLSLSSSLAFLGFFCVFLTYFELLHSWPRRRHNYRR